MHIQNWKNLKSIFMTDKEISQKIDAKLNHINKLEKTIKKQKTKSIIINIILFPLIIFAFRFLGGLIDLILPYYIYNSFVLLVLVILIYLTIKNSSKDIEYKKKLEKEVELLRGKKDL